MDQAQEAVGVLDGSVIQTWVPGLTILTGESREDRLARWLRTCNGVSLSNRVEVLKALIRRNVDPESLLSWEWETDCATTALGFLAAGCVTPEAMFHKLLQTVSVNGTSIAWIFQMGRELGVVRNYTPGSMLPLKGNLVAYAHGAHVEWILGDVDPTTGIADHGGGGRANNAITVGRGDIRTSANRPLTEIYDFISLWPSSPEAASGELDRVWVPDGPQQASVTEDA